MTTKDLFHKALPIYNLTGEEWDSLLELERSTSVEPLASALRTLIENQSRIEVGTILFDSAVDQLECPVTSEKQKQEIV